MKVARGRITACFITLSLCACSTNPPNAGTEDSPAQPLVKLGVAYMQQGDRATALQKLERALDLDPSLPSAHYAIALLYEQLGETDKAETHYRRALYLSPDYAEAHNAYGVFLCRQGKLTEAEEQFLTAAKNPLYTTPDLAYTNLGLCSMRKPDQAKAESNFRKALEINPKQPGALHQMAALSFDARRYLQARAYLERYQEVAPPTAQTLWLAARVERALGDIQAAHNYASMLEKEFRDSKEAQQLLESGER